MIDTQALTTIQNLPPVLFYGVYYVPTFKPIIEASCYDLAENLIMALRESNGLEFMPLEQRLALICELAQPILYQE